MSTGGPTPERLVAWRVLRRVADGAYADRAFAAEARRDGLTAQVRAQAHRLAFGAVQRRRVLDWLVDAHVRNPGAVEPEVRDVLRVGAFELAYSDAVPAPVTVDQAARLARAIPGVARRRAARAGVVNAVLRATARDAAGRLATLDDTTWRGAALAHSVPDWIARRLFDALGVEAARGALAAANLPSESALRHNPLRGTREDFEALLPPGWVRDDLLPDAYVLSGPFALEDSAIWAEGRGMGQSRASMLPVAVLDPRPGERVLDLCAAPGAKTTAIAAALGGEGSLTAVELHPARARALRDLARRMGARVDVVVGDARTVELPSGVDAVLVDPPCTGLGVLSARPDARWRRREEDVAGLVEIQTGLLRRALELVRPGGRVVYSTCTLLPEENEGVVTSVGAPVAALPARFAALAHPDLAGTLRTLPGRDGTDGFFVARIEP